jgi:hypothetical protein
MTRAAAAAKEKAKATKRPVEEISSDSDSDSEPLAKRLKSGKDATYKPSASKGKQAVKPVKQRKARASAAAAKGKAALEMGVPTAPATPEEEDETVAEDGSPDTPIAIESDSESGWFGTGPLVKSKRWSFWRSKPSAPEPAASELTPSPSRTGSADAGAQRPAPVGLETPVGRVTLTYEEEALALVDALRRKEEKAYWVRFEEKMKDFHDAEAAAKALCLSEKGGWWNEASAGARQRDEKILVRKEMKAEGWNTPRYGTVYRKGQKLWWNGKLVKGLIVDGLSLRVAKDITLTEEEKREAIEKGLSEKYDGLYDRAFHEKMKRLYVLGEKFFHDGREKYEYDLEYQVEAEELKQRFGRQLTTKNVQKWIKFAHERWGEKEGIVREEMRIEGWPRIPIKVPLDEEFPLLPFER